MRRMHATAAGILLGLGLAVGGAATAQTVIPGGENGDWKAYTFKKGGVTVCYMASAPKKSEGDYSKRDAAYALVTNDPTTSSHGEVSFVAGYPFKKDSTVGRSEEHTSELQSLMRISYAVFCLKKKQQTV